MTCITLSPNVVRISTTSFSVVFFFFGSSVGGGGGGLSVTKPSRSHHLPPSAVPTTQVPKSSPAAVASSFLCVRFSELLPLPLSEFVPLVRFQDFTTEYAVWGFGGISCPHLQDEKVPKTLFSLISVLRLATFFWQVSQLAYNIQDYKSGGTTACCRLPHCRHVLLRSQAVEHKANCQIFHRESTDLSRQHFNHSKRDVQNSGCEHSAVSWRSEQMICTITTTDSAV